MNQELFQLIETQGGIVNLSARSKFRFTGADRERYLNGQVTNDVRQVSRSRALYACVTDAKGRICGDVFIHNSPQKDTLWLDAEPPLRESLGQRLERYIISDDVELVDVSDDWHLWHIFGPASTALSNEKNGVLFCDRLACDGIDVWTPFSAPPPVVSCPSLSESDFEALRIIRGVPRYPNELNAETFPPEAGLESRAMSYTKGCYIGQEILSRIRTTGKMPKQLVQWQSAQPTEVGSSIFAPGDASKPIGNITSATWHPSLQRYQGLAFVRQGSVELHSKLPVGPDQPTIDATVEIFAFVN